MFNGAQAEDLGVVQATYMIVRCKRVAPNIAEDLRHLAIEATRLWAS
jgi:hypothetical protein